MSYSAPDMNACETAKDLPTSCDDVKERILIVQPPGVSHKHSWLQQNPTSSGTLFLTSDYHQIISWSGSLKVFPSKKQLYLNLYNSPIFLIEENWYDFFIYPAPFCVSIFLMISLFFNKIWFGYKITTSRALNTLSPVIKTVLSKGCQFIPIVGKLHYVDR